MNKTITAEDIISILGGMNEYIDRRIVLEDAFGIAGKSIEELRDAILSIQKTKSGKLVK